MIRKDINWIYILSCVIVVLIAAILLCGQFFTEDTVGGTQGNTTTPPTLSGGEIAAPNNRIRLYEKIDSDNIESIFVKNQYGSYTIARGKTEQTESLFFIDDLLFLQDDKFLMSMVSMRSAVGNAIALSRVTTDCADMSVYGLRGEASENGYYTVTPKEGSSHTVYIGNRTVAGGGYYAAVAGREGHVYVLAGTELESSVLMKKEALVSPILGNPTTDQDYFSLDNFYFTKYDRTAEAENQMIPIAAILYNEPDGNGKYPIGIGGYAEPYQLKYPIGCQPNLDTISDLYYALKDFKGDEVLYVGAEGSEGISQEVLAQYGLDDNSYLYSFMYSYRVTVGTAEEGKEAEYYDIITMVDFGEKNGKQYAHSFVVYGTVGADLDDVKVERVAHDMICSVNFTSFPFLAWEKAEFVDDYVFSVDISLVEEITLKKGTEYAQTFLLHYENVPQYQGDGTQKLVKVLESISIKDTDIVLDAGLICGYCQKARSSTRDAIWVCDGCGSQNQSQMCTDGKTGAVTNFRNLYRIILEMRLHGLVPKTTKHPVTNAYVDTKGFFEGTPDYSMTVKLSTGHVYEYHFYTYSALHSAMTFSRYDFLSDYANDKPAVRTENEYFLFTSLLDKVMADAERASEKTVVVVEDKA